MTRVMIGYDEALALTLSNIQCLDSRNVSIYDGQGRILSKNLDALVDSPSVDASLKDGYAVHSADIMDAAENNPVLLHLTGESAAGIPFNGVIKPGEAVRILTGGKIPSGADAVVAEEFTQIRDGWVRVCLHAAPGRNIFPKGGDVQKGDCIAEKGTRLSSGMVGLIAAAGHSEIPVYRKPHIAILATGDEVVMPGNPLKEGKLYASNLVSLNAWCRRYGWEVSVKQVPDDLNSIRAAIVSCLQDHDALLTSGGAWKGDRDLVAAALSDLGWTRYFHRVRMGPGKAAGFGTLDQKPVFILPGGPPSNLAAFLGIALPGLFRLAGENSETALPVQKVKVEKEIRVRNAGWTQFLFGTLQKNEDFPVFLPLDLRSRLQSAALAQAVLPVEEGKLGLTSGSVANAWILGDAGV